MSYDEEYDGDGIGDEAQNYLTKWEFTEGHNHPSGGIIFKEQMFFFSAIQPASTVVIKIEEIIGVLNSGYSPERYAKVEKELEKMGKPTDQKGQKRYDKIAAKAKLTVDEIQGLEREANLLMIKSIREYANYQNDYSVGLEGTGRKQGTGIASSQRTGLTPQPKKRGVLDKLLGKNKESDEISFPFQRRG